MQEQKSKVMNDSKKKKVALKTIRKIHSNNFLKHFNLFLKIKWGFLNVYNSITMNYL
jgi:hypothetical protein